MKVLRILGITLGLLLALLAAGVGVLYALFDGEKIKAEASRTVLEKTQRRLDIAGTLELSIWPDVSIRVGRLTLSERGGKEEFLALDSARVAVAVMPLLSKQVRVRRIEVDGLKATVVKRKDGTLNIADLMGGNEERSRVGAGGTASTPLQIDIAGIKVANAQFTWRDEKSGGTAALSRLDFGTGRVQADSAKQALAIDALSLAATFADGASTAAVKLGLSAIDGNAQDLKIGKLTLDLDAKSGETALKAHLDSPVAAKLAAQTFALEQIAGSIDLANPRMPMKQLKLPLGGSLRADLAQQTAALELATQFDESKIATKLRVAKFAPLALGFDLDIDQLNVDKYLPPKQAEDKAAKEDKLDFSALKGLDVNGAIRIGALQVSKLKLAKLNAKIAIAGGRLDVSPLTLNLYEGAASGSLSLNAAGNSLALKQNLSGISINPLMKDLADKDLLEGRGTVALDVTSRGDSVAAMKKALAGSAAVSLKDGAIKGINLAQSLRDLKGKLGAKQDETQQAKAGDQTDFSELTASLKIANGIARNDDLAMKSPFLRLSGAGDIDIGGGQMNYVAKASVVGTSAGQGGKEVDQLKGVTVPVRVSGPFDKLAYQIEFGSLVSDAAKTKVEAKKEEVKARVEEKAKDKLKGLFGK
ncbi:AsmA family protein [Sulfuritalea hydrogenivorans]|uniref:Putative AsmA family protein n=1 Tax=Sulfuritalea hydrogenivorans sk43H TaxID=1223802 RepID=W0SAP9_9PROT|nr:AsmA family protein [Sulfuritalea hydrogenivorans]BAO27957.1 putative AsmA family protein [Sulfuritalea hydrogenivorans sk43H]